MVGTVHEVDLSSILSLAKEFNDESYAQFVCQFPFSFYVERLKRINFVGNNKVLDIGCGYGQWTAALAAYNNQVIGLECNQTRISIAQKLMDKFHIKNVDFVLGDATSLPFEEAEFDAIFCYGVFMFLDRQKALTEFHRVLKPGGQMYICTNSFGWWLKLWLQNLFGSKNIRNAAYIGMTKGRKDGIPNSTGRRDVFKLLNPDFWQDIITGYEGNISYKPPNSALISPLACYKGKFILWDSVVEFIAKKKSKDQNHLRENENNNTHKVQEAIDKFQNSIINYLAKDSYEYITLLDKYPQPRPALDLVNNCYSEVIEQASEYALLLNRTEQIQWLYKKITENSQSEWQKIHSCLTFAQLNFFHHFAGQPMQSQQLSVLDPLAGLLIGFGRCGTVSRFLVDLFLCNDVPARLLTAGCHTSAEVWCQGRWILADASLFPPGIYPVDEGGDPVGLDQVVNCPTLLDQCPSYINYHHEYIQAFLKQYPETESMIGHYLRAPILPSSAYFGEEYFKGRVPGLIDRLSKQKYPSDWNLDKNFGWLLGYEKDSLQGPCLPTNHRPSQVIQIYRKDNNICWEQPFILDKEAGISYNLVVYEKSRFWNYRKLPIGCNFSVYGKSVRTKESKICLNTLLSLGRYLTIYAEIDKWQEKTIFYLPSQEFDLASLPEL